MLFVWCQVFASGTGNRRHPLFFLDGLRARLLGGRQQGRQPRSSNELQLPTIKSSSVVSTSSLLRLTATSSAAGKSSCCSRRHSTYVWPGHQLVLSALLLRMFTSMVLSSTASCVLPACVHALQQLSVVFCVACCRQGCC